jgi:sulfite reductase (NADPH) flavoprotein alpha-component
VKASSPTLLTTQLGPEKDALLSQLVDGLDGRALNWLSGYLAGLATQERPLAVAAPRVEPAPQPQSQLTIVYGSQTGNSRRIAEALFARAQAAGLAARLFSAGKYPVRELAKERLLSLVISTHGDGVPPDDARGLCDFLLGKRAPRLSQLGFTVLALGDSSYPRFCETGRVLDERLAELGATRLLPRADCDLDFEAPAEGWLTQTLDRARETLTEIPVLAQVTPLRPAVLPLGHAPSRHLAEVLVNQPITGRGALKDVRHLELSLAASGLTYEPGDALSVRARNPDALVDAVLKTLGLPAGHEVTREDKKLTLRTWLTDELELTRLSRPFVIQHLALAKAQAVDGADLRELLATHQVIDLLRAHPAPWTAEALVGALRRLAPRLYSIASSQKRVGEEAHLTVGVVAYQAFGFAHHGAASSHLASRAVAEDRVEVAIEPNERFRLPADGSRDILMIGPGTGVAPFRGFVQERAEVGASGRNWLFFGEQHFRSQFLYQAEWQAALSSGELHRLSLAFSRDQEEKVYVQHRLREAGREVFEWLDGGAHLYVCGDAKRMAADVHAALRDVVVEHGGRSAEDAEVYLDQLRAEQRYQRDVY